MRRLGLASPMATFSAHTASPPPPSRLQPAYELQVDTLRKPREQRRPMAREPSRLLKKQMTTALLFSPRHAGGPRTDRSDAALASSAAEHRPRRARVALSELVAGSSSGLGREVSDAHQVVGREGKRKHPVHAAGPPVPRLAHQPDRLEPAEDRSEEHTSELQSPCNLVCRLLLEKKKNIKSKNVYSRVNSNATTQWRKPQ